MGGERSGVDGVLRLTGLARTRGTVVDRQATTASPSACRDLLAEARPHTPRSRQDAPPGEAARSSNAASKVAANQRVTFSVNIERLHLFDPESGEALRPAPPPADSAALPRAD